MTQADTDRHKQQQTQTCWKCLWSCSWAPTHTHKHTHTPTHKTGAARCRCWARLGKAAGEIEHASLCNQRRAETKRLQYCFSDARSRHSHTHISKLTDKSRLLLMHSHRGRQKPHRPEVLCPRHLPQTQRQRGVRPLGSFWLSVSTHKSLQPTIRLHLSSSG